MKYQTRKILRNKAAQILDLQKKESKLQNGTYGESKYLKYYEKHWEWLDNAIKQIKKRDRVAFGVFTLSSDGEEKLVASTIIKKGKYSFEIEIKNFYVYESQMEKVGYPNPITPTNKAAWENEKKTIRRLLIQKVERFCQTRGFRRIEIAIPDKKYFLLDAFMAQRFLPLYSTKSNFIASDDQFVCVLQKKLDPIYTSDPIDFDRMVKWALGNSFKTKVRTNPQPIVRKENTSPTLFYRYQFSTFLEGERYLLNEGINFQINANVVVYQGGMQPLLEESITDQLFNEDCNLKLFVTKDYYYDIKKYCKSHNIEYLYYQKIKNILSNPIADELIDLRPENIQGIFVEMDDSYREKVRGKKDGFVLLLLDAMGSTFLPQVLISNLEYFVGSSPLLLIIE